jgi:hypothetical protein
MRSAMARVCMYAMGLALMVNSASGHLLAGVPRTPEIDGGQVSAGLGLLTAAVLIVRSRRRSKK